MNRLICGGSQPELIFYFHFHFFFIKPVTLQVVVGPYLLIGSMHISLLTRYRACADWFI